MIKVTVELISAVDPSRSKLLGIAVIANVGGDRSVGDYVVKLSKWAPKTSEVWRGGEVRGFDRVKRGSWDLLYLALKNIVGDRNP